jgi:hypothetical protein
MVLIVAATCSSAHAGSSTSTEALPGRSVRIYRRASVARMLEHVGIKE